jgi:hypothetical protein
MNLRRREFDVVEHDAGQTLDVATLHEELEVGHDLVLELLEPFVELHMVVGDGVVVLALTGDTGLVPVYLCELQGGLTPRRWSNTSPWHRGLWTVEAKSVIHMVTSRLGWRK